MLSMIKVFWDSYVSSIFPVLLETILLKEADSRKYFHSQSFCILFINVENIVSHKPLNICNYALLLLYCGICPASKLDKTKIETNFNFPFSKPQRERMLLPGSQGRTVP